MPNLRHIIAQNNNIDKTTNKCTISTFNFCFKLPINKRNV